MIQYKQIAAGLFTDSKIEAFGIQPPHPTTFMIWLLTGPVMGVVPGCASMGRYGMAERSGWTPEQIDEMVVPLIKSGILQFDSKAPFIWLPNAIKYTPPKSPSNVTSWQSDWRKLPNCVLKERAWHGLRAHCDFRDAQIEFSKAKPKKDTTSFSLAFNKIERPPESPIEPDLWPDHRADHRPQEKKDLNNNINNNINNNSDTASQHHGSASVTPIDLARGAK